MMNIQKYKVKNNSQVRLLIFYYVGDAVQKAWENEVDRIRRNNSNKKPSLWLALIKVFGAELLLYGLILAAMEFLIRSNIKIFIL